MTTKAEFAAVLRAGAAEILQPALGRAGGIWEMKKVAAIAEVFNAQMAPHLYAGPVEWAANIHLAASIPNILLLETIETPFHDQLIKGSIRAENGYVTAPSAPGLGIEVDEELARAHPFNGTDLHLNMAAHLEGKGSSVLDFTGFAQKFGTVLSYIRLSNAPETLNQVRIDEGGADAVIGCDVVVSSAPKASAHYRADTKVVLNRAEMPTGDLVLRRDADLMAGLREKTIAEAVGPQNLSGFNANEAAETMLGDAVLANVMPRAI